MLTGEQSDRAQQLRVLTERVLGGQLSWEQRVELVRLLYQVDSAQVLMPLVGRYSEPWAQAGYLLGLSDSISIAYTRLRAAPSAPAAQTAPAQTGKVAGHAMGPVTAK